MEIKSIEAFEILDSRGNPTVSAVCELASGVLGQASVPSGASTGEFEAKELRDGGMRYGGLGVFSAVEIVNTTINKNISGKKFNSQEKLDNFLCNLDGTPDKSKLGANAILAVSMAFARAMSVERSQELYEYLAEVFYEKKVTKLSIPTPMFNILNGGKHAGNNVDIQETMIVPTGYKTFKEKLQVGSEIYHHLKNYLVNNGYNTGVGDEGGFAPDFDSNERVLKTISEIIAKSGYSNKKVRISMDVAANSFYDNAHGVYFLSADETHLDSSKMINLLNKWAKKYELLSIEDGLWEEDTNWSKLTAKIKPTISIGDDLFVTSPDRIEAGADNKMANGVIIKLNQIGTVTETLKAVKIAQKNKMKVVVSHRSGETEDTFIADLAVAVGADFIKSGAPARSERLAKYNRLLRIEDQLKEENYA